MVGSGSPELPSLEGIRQKFKLALQQFLSRDLYLIQAGTAERNVVATFHAYLREQFDDWDVDCEYNRDGRDPKKQVNNLGRSANVLPDIIIHRRGKLGPNLIAREAKFSGVSSTRDLHKVKQYIKLQGYHFGLLLTIPISALGASFKLNWWSRNGQGEPVFRNSEYVSAPQEVSASEGLRVSEAAGAGQHPFRGKHDSMKRLTLHEAMEQVLIANGGRMSVEDLAQEIGMRGLYQRTDGLAATVNQLYARATKHAKFEVGNGEIWLR